MNYQLACDIAIAANIKSVNEIDSTTIIPWPTNEDEFQKFRTKFNGVDPLESEEYKSELANYDFSLYTIADGKVQKLEPLVSDSQLTMLVQNIPI